MDMTQYSLNTLLDIATQTHLIARYEKHPRTMLLWVDGHKVVLSHHQALTFLRGMLWGFRGLQQP